MCLRRLGEWFSLSPKLLLGSEEGSTSEGTSGGPTNLKYVGWMLYDKVLLWLSNDD
jgi:hypothetical protein